MTIAFYITAAIAVLATLMVVIGRHAVHALLYLIVSLFAVAVLFYLIGAPFAAALEVIVYAGAIMVLFVFVIMMLNVGRDPLVAERPWMTLSHWLGPAVLCALLLAQWLWILGQGDGEGIAGNTVAAESVGIALFSRYLLATEMAGLLLLAALVGAFHLGRKRKEDER
jgi:NADH-quinone oxidoreductase subunit J